MNKEQWRLLIRASVAASVFVGVFVATAFLIPLPPSKEDLRVFLAIVGIMLGALGAQAADWFLCAFFEAGDRPSAS